MGVKTTSKVYNYISIEENEEYVVISSSLSSIEDRKSFLQRILKKLDNPDANKQYIHCDTPDCLLKN